MHDFYRLISGKVAEGIDFDRHYGRCVIIFGIPYQYTLSHVLRARLNFMRERYNIRDNDFLTFDALRQAAQCVGRVIRSKTDYGIVILADSRYNRQDKRSKFPPWILQFVKESSLNLPTDSAVDQIKTFLRYMGQPIDQESLHSILLNESQVSGMFSVHKLPPSGAIGMSAVQLEGESGKEGESDEVVEEMVEGEVGVNSIQNNTTNNNNQNHINSVASMLSRVDVNGQEYIMDVVSSVTARNNDNSAGETTAVVEAAAIATTTVAAGVISAPPVAQFSTAAVPARSGGNRYSKSLFLFEDILDASDDE